MYQADQESLEGAPPKPLTALGSPGEHAPRFLSEEDPWFVAVQQVCMTHAPSTCMQLSVFGHAGARPMQQGGQMRGAACSSTVFPSESNWTTAYKNMVLRSADREVLDVRVRYSKRMSAFVTAMPRAEAQVRVSAHQAALPESASTPQPLQNV